MARAVLGMEKESHAIYFSFFLSIIAFKFALFSLIWARTETYKQSVISASTSLLSGYILYIYCSRIYDRFYYKDTLSVRHKRIVNHNKQSKHINDNEKNEIKNVVEMQLTSAHSTSTMESNPSIMWSSVPTGMLARCDE